MIKRQQTREQHPQDQTVDQDGVLRISLVNQGITARKKRICPLHAIDIKELDYKNLKLLGKFISERGKILPSRITGVCAKKQRALSSAIKRARNLALLSFISKDEE
jgi:small subunit ribosomal protein S18